MDGLGDQRVAELPADGGAHRVGDADTSGVGKALQPGGDVDTVTIDVAPVLDYVTRIDADAELHLAPAG